MKKLKQLLPVILIVAGALSAVGAILLFAVAAPRADATYKRVLDIIMGILMLLMSALVFYYSYASRDAEPNFFLFDRKKKRNIPVEELKFSIVNERMNFFLTMVCDSAEQLWKDLVLEKDLKLGYRRIYRPLLAYKMLYDLADKNQDSYWALLIGADSNTLESLYSALEQGGEGEIIRVFRYVMENYRNNPDQIKDFVTGNLKYLQGRMMSYIKRNIEQFY